MNLFENLQMMKESGNLISNDEFVKNECEKYGINKRSYGTNRKILGLDPIDGAAKEFIKKIEADGYKLLDTQKDGIENHESENDVTLVYGKEVEGNRCVIAISIHPSENYIIVSCGYDETEYDNEFFENSLLMREANESNTLTVKIQVGKNTATDGEGYYNIFPERNKSTLTKELWDKLEASKLDVTHFPSYEEALEYISEFSIEHGINLNIE